MRRLSVLIGLVLLAELFAQSIPERGQELRLDAVTRATTRYQPLVFRTHQEHVERLGGGCVECHHLIGNEPPEVHSCSRCHNQPEASLDLKAAAHRTCRGCHQAERLRPGPRERRPPLDCLDCHTERTEGAVPGRAGATSGSAPEPRRSDR